MKQGNFIIQLFHLLQLFHSSFREKRTNHPGFLILRHQTDWLITWTGNRGSQKMTLCSKLPVETYKDKPFHLLGLPELWSDRIHRPCLRFKETQSKTHVIPKMSNDSMNMFSSVQIYLKIGPGFVKFHKPPANLVLIVRLLGNQKNQVFHLIYYFVPKVSPNSNDH